MIGFIVGNAARDAWRGKGRSLLVATVVCVVTCGASIGLGIRDAAELGMDSALSSSSVTATIGVDRSALMEKARSGFEDSSSSSGSSSESSGSSSSDGSRDRMRDAMDGVSLTLDEYGSYAKDAGVDVGTYYSESAGLTRTDSFQPVESSSSASESSTAGSSVARSGSGSYGARPDAAPGNGGQAGNGAGRGGEGGPGDGWARSTGDFTIIGYSSDSALGAAENGSFTLESGAAPGYGDDDAGKVLISKELADFNNLKVGDAFTVKVAKASVSSLSSDESMEYGEATLTVAGIYENAVTDGGDGMGGGPMGGSAQDPANAIYTSVATLDKLGLAPATDGSDAADSPAKDTSINYTYVLADKTAYDTFSKAVDAKLDDGYVVQSRDVDEYERNASTLRSIESFSTTLTVVIIGVGAVVLAAVGLLAVRDRRYEVGVLTAIGVRKGRVAMQFLTESVIVALIGVVIGVGVGAAIAGPASDALLSTQRETQQSQSADRSAMLGRAEQATGTPGQAPLGGGDGTPAAPAAGEGMPSAAATTVDLDDVHVDGTVVLQVAAIGLGLAVAASLSGILFIMRYDPLRILAERS